jgi:hypothetical protein
METMSCEQARRLFDEKLDGVISETDNTLLEKHLAQCEACRHEYETLEKTHAHLCSLAVEVPSELSARVMESIGKEPKPRASILRRLRPLVALPIAALLCLAVIHSPLFDGMFAAKSEADNVNMEVAAPEAEHDYSADIMDGANGTPSEDKSEAFVDTTAQETPQIEIKQVYAIADSNLLLMRFDEAKAMLCRDGGDEAVEMLFDVIYSQNNDIITIEKDGKKASFVLADDALIPTDKTLLDALLSK